MEEFIKFTNEQRMGLLRAMDNIRTQVSSLVVADGSHWGGVSGLSQYIGLLENRSPSFGILGFAMQINFPRLVLAVENGVRVNGRGERSLVCRADNGLASLAAEHFGEFAQKIGAGLAGVSPL